LVFTSCSLKRANLIPNEKNPQLYFGKLPQHEISISFRLIFKTTNNSKYDDEPYYFHLDALI